MRKGNGVLLILDGAGVCSTEYATVLRVDRAGVWLDNGPGNDPSGPFDRNTGRSLYHVMDGFSSRIVPLPAKEAQE